jgi:hypothetical protein
MRSSMEDIEIRRVFVAAFSWAREQLGIANLLADGGWPHARRGSAGARRP